MTIPKVIHYCWFGKGDKNDLIKHCIESWKRHCPDYEIIEWNESNFDVDSNRFVKQAYESKAWAFVSDYVRLYVLDKYGGFYLDSDFELLKPLDKLLLEKAFTGEQGTSIPAAIIGAQKGNIWIKRLLDYYNDRSFIVNGKKDLTTNSRIITKISVDDFNYNFGDKFILNGMVKIFDNSYFAPLSPNREFENISPDKRKNYYQINYRKCYGIHHFAGSWSEQNFKNKLKKKGVQLLIKFIGFANYRKIKSYYIRQKYKR